MRGRTEGSQEQWDNVAAAVEARMAEIRIETQTQLARQAGVSDVTVRSIQEARQLTYRTESLRKVSRALRWESDGIERILRGGEALTEAERLRATFESTRERIAELDAQIEEDGDDADQELYMLRNQYVEQSDILRTQVKYEEAKERGASPDELVAINKFRAQLQGLAPKRSVPVEPTTDERLTTLEQTVAHHGALLDEVLQRLETQAESESS